MQGRADTHIHTQYSGFSFYAKIPLPESMTTPKQVLQRAKRIGLDVVCITDHDEIRGAMEATKLPEAKDVEVVVGQEINAAQGEILALFVNELIPQGLPVQETIDLVREQGGLAIAPHPYSSHCPCVGDLLLKLDLDGVEVINAGHVDRYTNKKAKEINDTILHKAEVAGSDAHSARMIGNAYTSFPGKSAEDLYKAIKNKQTKACGSHSTMFDWIGWSWEMCFDISRRIVRNYGKEPVDGDPHRRLDAMLTKKKILVLGGTLFYMTTPSPIVAGMVGQTAMKLRGKNRMRLMEKYGSFDSFERKHQHTDK